MMFQMSRGKPLKVRRPAKLWQLHLPHAHIFDFVGDVQYFRLNNI